VYAIEFSDESRTHVQAIVMWWRANRPAAPELFAEELRAAVSRLRLVPLAGSAYPSSPVSGSRRLLMPRTQYHVYYVVRAEDRRVLVHAVWHAKRGHGPQLGT